jgi:hypothetical protein
MATTEERLTRLENAVSDLSVVVKRSHELEFRTTEAANAWKGFFEAVDAIKAERPA